LCNKQLLVVQEIKFITHVTHNQKKHNLAG
jgi:hypothetical protein